eukprot:scaffold240449_cov17-Prasinocladus_malaysianus.AAC.1
MTLTSYQDAPAIITGHLDALLSLALGPICGLSVWNRCGLTDTANIMRYTYECQMACQRPALSGEANNPDRGPLCVAPSRPSWPHY